MTADRATPEPANARGSDAHGSSRANATTASTPQRGGSDDPATAGHNNDDSSTTPVSPATPTGRASRRGPYRCGRCGQLLKGHKCPYKEYQTRTPSRQRNPSTGDHADAPAMTSAVSTTAPTTPTTSRSSRRPAGVMLMQHPQTPKGLSSPTTLAQQLQTGTGSDSPFHYQGLSQHAPSSQATLMPGGLVTFTAGHHFYPAHIIQASNASAFQIQQTPTLVDTGPSSTNQGSATTGPKQEAGTHPLSADKKKQPGTKDSNNNSSSSSSSETRLPDQQECSTKETGDAASPSTTSTATALKTNGEQKADSADSTSARALPATPLTPTSATMPFVGPAPFSPTLAIHHHQFMMSPTGQMFPTPLSMIPSMAHPNFSIGPAMASAMHQSNLQTNANSAENATNGSSSSSSSNESGVSSSTTATTAKAHFNSAQQAVQSSTPSRNNADATSHSDAPATQAASSSLSDTKAETQAQAQLESSNNGTKATASPTTPSQQQQHMLAHGTPMLAAPGSFPAGFQGAMMPFPPGAFGITSFNPAGVSDGTDPPPTPIHFVHMNAQYPPQLVMPDGAVGDPLGRTITRLGMHFGISRTQFLQLFGEEMLRHDRNSGPTSSTSPSSSPASPQTSPATTETLTPYTAHVCSNLFQRGGFEIKLSDGRVFTPGQLDVVDNRIVLSEVPSSADDADLDRCADGELATGPGGKSAETEPYCETRDAAQTRALSGVLEEKGGMRAPDSDAIIGSTPKSSTSSAMDTDADGEGEAPQSLDRVTRDPVDGCKDATNGDANVVQQATTAVATSADEEGDGSNSRKRAKMTTPPSNSLGNTATSVSPKAMPEAFPTPQSAFSNSASQQPTPARSAAAPSTPPPQMITSEQQVQPLSTTTLASTMTNAV